MVTADYTKWSLPGSLWLKAIQSLPHDINGDRLYRDIARAVGGHFDDLIEYELSAWQVDLFGPGELHRISTAYHGN